MKTITRSKGGWKRSRSENSVGMFEIRRQEDKEIVYRPAVTSDRDDIIFSTWWYEQNLSCYLPKFIKGIWLEPTMKGEYLCVKEQLWAIAEELAEKPIS